MISWFLDVPWNRTFVLFYGRLPIPGLEPVTVYRLNKYFWIKYLLTELMMLLCNRIIFSLDDLGAINKIFSISQNWKVIKPCSKSYQILHKILLSNINNTKITSMLFSTFIHFVFNLYTFCRFLLRFIWTLHYHTNMVPLCDYGSKNKTYC